MANQGRKKCKTTNILILTDRNGLAIACGRPVADNHNDLFKIKEQLKEMLGQLQEAKIPMDGLFLNADAGFQANSTIKALYLQEIQLNAPRNKRNSKMDSNDQYLFDDQMYQERIVMERNNAWFDRLRTLLVKQDKSLSSWWNWHFMACTY